MGFANVPVLFSFAGAIFCGLLLAWRVRTVDEPLFQPRLFVNAGFAAAAAAGIYQAFYFIGGAVGSALVGPFLDWRAAGLAPVINLLHIGTVVPAYSDAFLLVVAVALGALLVAAMLSSRPAQQESRDGDRDEQPPLPLAGPTPPAAMVAMTDRNPGWPPVPGGRAVRSYPALWLSVDSLRVAGLVRSGVV